MAKHRKRLRRVEIPGQARYLTFSCYHRLPLLKNDRIKHLLLDRIGEVRATGAFKLWAWVIMPEHVHLLIYPNLPDHPADRILREIKRPVGQQVISRWRQMHAAILQNITDRRGAAHFWQVGGGYDRNIISDEELFEKINYIHENPIKRELVSNAEDYPWSSARSYAGQADALIDLDRME